MSRYGIAEWYGNPFIQLKPVERRTFASVALGESETRPRCPFQANNPICRKAGGVCTIQLYEDGGNGRVGAPANLPVAVCPARFEQSNLLVEWLGEIVGFPPAQVSMAREIPFMESIATGKPAGKIDLVVAREDTDRLAWYGLEIQAVYFSGPGMTSEFNQLKADDTAVPPYPSQVRRPDWRSSSAKRLMPQLQVKVPTLRRWGSKMAVAVDLPFFEAIGGPSPSFSQDLSDGDIIWLVPTLRRQKDGSFQLERGHWEVLTLEDSSEKLLAARTIQRSDFESILRAKLVPLA